MKYTKALRAEIVKRIDFDGYQTDDGRPFAPKTDADKISLLLNVAMDEVGHEFERKGQQGGLAYWLSGLPNCIDLPIYYSDILEFAVSVGTIPADYSDKLADRVCSNFYNFVAANILQYHAAILKERAKGKLPAFSF